MPSLKVDQVPELAQALLDLRYLAMHMAGRCTSEMCFDRELAAMRTAFERELCEREQQTSFRCYGPGEATKETAFRHRGDRGGIDTDWQPPQFAKPTPVLEVHDAQGNLVASQTVELGETYEITLGKR